VGVIPIRCRTPFGRIHEAIGAVHELVQALAISMRHDPYGAGDRFAEHLRGAVEAATKRGQHVLGSGSGHQHGEFVAAEAIAAVDALAYRSVERDADLA